VRLTVEQQARAFATYGVCGNEACDKCGKVLAEVRWTRRDMPETYCSQPCRDGVERVNGRCDGCGVDLAGKRRGARWCSDSCRMRSRVKDSTNNPKTLIQNIGLVAASMALGYHPTKTALLPDNPKKIGGGSQSRLDEMAGNSVAINPGHAGEHPGASRVAELPACIFSEGFASSHCKPLGKKTPAPSPR